MFWKKTVKDPKARRHRMVEQQMRQRGITDERLLNVFRVIPRQQFVPEAQERKAYEDHPIAIGAGQTISQPYMVALMTQCLDPRSSSKVLEIGTGSGYQTAVLAALSSRVYTIERIPVLLERAKQLLGTLGYRNIFFRCDDGAKGWPEATPYDGILVSCAASSVPLALLNQLGEGGTLVMPVGGTSRQTLMTFHKNKGDIHTREICRCAFVPFIHKPFPSPDA